MKKVMIALLALTAFAGNAFAADVIEMKKGVKFDHKAHQVAVNDCTKCHSTAAGGQDRRFRQGYCPQDLQGLSCCR